MPVMVPMNIPVKLLDLFTLREKLGSLRGKKVTILGDILFSRVARSNIWGLLKLGVKVTLAGPSTLFLKNERIRTYGYIQFKESCEQHRCNKCY